MKKLEARMRAHIPKKVRDAVKTKFNGHCAYCGHKPEKLCIDHVHPVARAHLLKKDVNDESNLYPACLSCNNYKMSLDVESFRNELQMQVDRARKSSVNFRLAERFGQLQIIKKPIKFFFEEYQAFLLSKEGK